MFDVLKYSKYYIDEFVEKKVNEIFLEKYLNDSSVSLKDVIIDYLDDNIEDIYEDISEGLEEMPICIEHLWIICYHRLTKNDNLEKELIESVDEPYRGLSPRDRNPSLK